MGIQPPIEHAVPRPLRAQWELPFSRGHFSFQRQHLLWAPVAELSHLSRGDTVQGVLGWGKFREPQGAGQGCSLETHIAWEEQKVGSLQGALP